MRALGDFAPNPAGGGTYTGGGVTQVVDANGAITSFSPNLGTLLAWKQNQVYIAAGVGFLLGVGIKMYLNKRK